MADSSGKSKREMKRERMSPEELARYTRSENFRKKRRKHRKADDDAWQQEYDKWLQMYDDDDFSASR